MESILHNTKRKKRKTRKCLDEIRKRSRSTLITGDITNKRIQNLDFADQNSRKRSNNCITSKRLTLTMLGKAVQSKTITRPVLIDAKKKLTKNTDLKSPLTTMVVTNRSGGNTPKACIESDVPRQNYYKKIHDSGNSPGMILFSPLQQEENRIVRESANEESANTITSTASRSVEDLGYHLYEELIEDIPLYIRRNIPNLINDDVMHKAKICLQKIYFENLQRQYEPLKRGKLCINQNVFTSDRPSSPIEIIVQNPMDYIRTGWRQSYQQMVHESSPSNADTSPLETPHILCSPVASPQPHTVLSHTPDYEFYPHRLNE